VAPPAAKAPAESSLSPADRVLAGVSLAAIAFFLLQILTFGYGRDQGIYAVVARTVLEGGMPYRDAWDFKPPGIFIVFAASRALFGAGQHGIRVLEVLGLIAMIAAMVRLSAQLWGRRLVGLSAGALAVMVHAQLDFWHTAQPESFGGMATIFGLVLALSGERRAAGGDRRRAALFWIAAGVLFGAAGLLKPPLAGGGAATAAVLGWRAYKRSIGQSDRNFRRVFPSAIAPGIFIAIGGVLPFAACLAWFAAKGALRDLYEVLFVFTPYYTAIGWEGASVIAMTYYSFTEWLTSYTSLVTVGLFLLVILRRLPGSTGASPGAAGAPADPGDRPVFPDGSAIGIVLLASVIGIHVAGVAMQGKFFPYHYGATWPPTALLAALGLHRAWERYGRRSPLRVGLFFVLLVIAAFGRSATKDVPGSFLRRSFKRIALFTASPRDQEWIDRMASVADVNAVANRAAADFVRARAPEGRPIFVWGFEPVIYDLADRPFSSRYIYNVAQRVAWAKAPARELLMRDLAARPPAAIVVERHDVFPMVTGDAIDSADTLHDFTALRDLIRGRYQLATSIEDLDIYLEAPAAEATGR
jgi:4-amino-4-deoxy-L-arabinose transferase-like glycosyltransferase